MFNLTKKQTSIIAVMAVVAAVMFAGPIALGLELQQASAGGWWWHHHHHWGWNSWW
jgi:Spy/CpxP family protein refolding chaperone